MKISYIDCLITHYFNSTWWWFNRNFCRSHVIFTQFVTNFPNVLTKHNWWKALVFTQKKSSYALFLVNSIWAITYSHTVTFLWQINVFFWFQDVYRRLLKSWTNKEPNHTHAALSVSLFALPLKRILLIQRK